MRSAAAISGPTSADHRPNTAPTRVRSDQSCSVTSESTSRPSGCGSSAPGPAPVHFRRGPAIRRRVGCGRAAEAARAASSAARAMSLGRAGRSSLTARSPLRHGIAVLSTTLTSDRAAVPTSTRAPRSSAGTSSSTAAVISVCSAERATEASAARRSASRVAKTSSRIRIGSSPSALKQREGGELERERQRPGLPVAGEALGRGRAQVDDEVVAVRADQRHRRGPARRCVARRPARASPR